MAWEQQAVSKLSADFDVTSNAACRSAAQTWSDQLGHVVKLKVGRAAGEAMRVYAYCQAHKDCPCVWRHAFDVTEAGAKEQTIHMKGTHSNEPRLVRGTPVTTRLQADALTDGRTPMQAMVRLVEQGADVEDWPSNRALKQARRRNQRKGEKTEEFGGGTGLGQWLENLERINQKEAGWEAVFRKDGCGIVMHQSFAKVTCVASQTLISTPTCFSFYFPQMLFF